MLRTSQSICSAHSQGYLHLFLWLFTLMPAPWAGHHLGHLLHHPAVPAPGLLPARQDRAHLRCGLDPLPLMTQLTRLQAALCPPCPEHSPGLHGISQASRAAKCTKVWHASELASGALVQACFAHFEVEYLMHAAGIVEGQIYIPEANWTLMVLTIIVVAGFRDALSISNAYGEPAHPGLFCRAEGRTRMHQHHRLQQVPLHCSAANAAARHEHPTAACSKHAWRA